MAELLLVALVVLIGLALLPSLRQGHTSGGTGELVRVERTRVTGTRQWWPDIEKRRRRPGSTLNPNPSEMLKASPPNGGAFSRSFHPP